MEAEYNEFIGSKIQYVIIIRDGVLVGTTEIEEGQHVNTTGDIEPFGGLAKFKERYKELTGKDYEG